MRIFIIGPGGVGKTVTGEVLAKRLKYSFIDLDQKFMERVGHIVEYIDKYGYQKYCYSNSGLFKKLLNENKDNFVMPLSSGFLVHEGLDDLVSKHKKLIKKNGVSILLLPSRNVQTSAEIVVKRQIKRGFGDVTEEKREKGIRKYIERAIRYKTLGDIKIYSSENPKIIVKEILKKLKTFGGTYTSGT
jgi:shikimate kinase